MILFFPGSDAVIDACGGIDTVTSTRGKINKNKQTQI